ncbi:MAG: DNA integrity scanning protein DisA [Desulfobacteraceae bacterium]|nr:DNA integrity scanning protein DisA [Desulfobacteraceae bacterium]
MIAAELLPKIRKVAPGTELRRALDEIVNANIGSLVVFLDDLKSREAMLQGGFYIGSAFSVQKLYELSKMDGAIIVDKAITRIFAANVHLIPDAAIPTDETGMRHRTAERVAKQTGRLVIAVSQKKGGITVFYKNYKHRLHNLNMLMTRFNLTLNSLARLREALDRQIHGMNIEEFEYEVQLLDVVSVINRAREILTIPQEIEPFVVEAGVEGRLSAMQFKTMSLEIRTLLTAIIMDYSKKEPGDAEVAATIKNLITRKTRDLTLIAKMLGWKVATEADLQQTTLVPRGYRLLTCLAKIPMPVARNVVRQFSSIPRIRNANAASLKRIDGIGEKRAGSILESIRMIRARLLYR